MLTASDFVHLPYTPDLTQAGIHHACRSLPTPDDYLGKSVIDRLQRIVARNAAELALRRHLSTLDLPFENWASTPFTAPQQLDVSLGKRRCVLKSLLIPQQGQIHHVQQDPKMLLSAAAFIPEDQLFGEHHNDLDLFLFAYVLALATPGYEAFHRTSADTLPVFLFHPLPSTWVLPDIWAPLGPITVRNEQSSELNVELGGLNDQHSFITEQIPLAAVEHRQASGRFHTLSYLHATSLPAGRLGVHSQRLKRSHWVQPLEWENLWIAGTQIILAGWISRGSFRQSAARQYRGSQSFLHPRTSTPHRWLPIAHLHPMQELFDVTRDWASSSFSEPSRNRDVG